MKPESLVIAGQLYCGEYVLESCTHCPSSQGSREYPKFLHFVRKRATWRRQAQTVRRIMQTEETFFSATFRVCSALFSATLQTCLQSGGPTVSSVTGIKS